jgi:hypothetical protein
MELLLQLQYRRETNFIGKRSEPRLTKDSWDTIMNMKFEGEKQKGWSFTGNPENDFEEAVMVDVLNTIVVHVVTKLQQLSSILNSSYLRC